jgi:membrane protease YdiL (CAAX protease family)
MVVVGYLVGYWLWVCLGPTQWRFFAEPYDGTFLVILAVVLWGKGRAGHIQKYYLGRLVPSLHDLPRAILLALLVNAWAIAMTLLTWQEMPMEDVGFLRALRLFVTAPIIEEILCRGVILAILLRYTESGRWMALLISALFFAGIHVVQDIYQLLALCGAGILLGYGYILTSSVPFCMLCHSMSNATIYLISHGTKNAS